MPLILEFDKQNYVDKNDIRRLKSYGSSLWIPKGKALFLPKEVDGDGIGDIFSNVAKFVSDNKDTIKNVGDVVSSIGQTASNITGNVIDNVRKINELKALKEQLNANKEPAISDESKDRIINVGKKKVKGEGFKIIE